MHKNKLAKGLLLLFFPVKCSVHGRFPLLRGRKRLLSNRLPKDHPHYIFPDKIDPSSFEPVLQKWSSHGTHRYFWFCTWWCTEEAPVSLQTGRLCLMKGHTSPWGGQTGGEASRAPARSTWGICVITHPSSKQPGKQAAEKGHGDRQHAWLRNDDGRFTNIHIRP